MTKPFNRYEPEIDINNFISRSIAELSEFAQMWNLVTTQKRKFCAVEWQRRFDQFREAFDGAGMIPEASEETKKP